MIILNIIIYIIHILVICIIFNVFYNSSWVVPPIGSSSEIPIFVIYVVLDNIVVIIRSIMLRFWVLLFSIEIAFNRWWNNLRFKSHSILVALFFFFFWYKGTLIKANDEWDGINYAIYIINNKKSNTSWRVMEDIKPQWKRGSQINHKASCKVCFLIDMINDNIPILFKEFLDRSNERRKFICQIQRLSNHLSHA